MTDSLTPLSFEERLTRLEKALPRPTIAGTTLQRVMAEKSGIEWSLALGPMSLPKAFFRGPTIEDVLTQAEHAVANMKDGHLPTDWDRLDVVLRGGDVEFPS